MAEPVSLKLTEAEKQADKTAMCGPCDSAAPDYPWGLRVRLTEKEIDKLGIKDLPQVGAEMVVNGIGKVVEVYASDTGDARRRGFEFILTDLALSPKDEGEKPSAARVMFPGMKEG